MRTLKLGVRLLLTLTLLTSGCSTCPKPKPVQHTVDESDLTTWPAECERLDDGSSKCPDKIMSWVYRNMINLYYDWEGAATALKFATRKADLVIEGKDAQLDQPHRKWYYMIPLGFLAGAAAATVIFLTAPRL